MDTNTTNNNGKELQKQPEEAKWYKIPLRDWAIIIGFVAYYVNSAGANATYNTKIETIVNDVSEMKTIFKEMQQQQKTDYKYLEDKNNKMATEIEVLKQRVQNLENNK